MFDNDRWCLEHRMGIKMRDSTAKAAYEISGSHGGEKEVYFWDVAPLKLTDVSEVRIASIIRAVMKTVRTCETSVNFVTTRRYIPED
jgi:hypothetical protein